MRGERLLVVDDQAEIGEYVKTVAESLGYDVTVAVDPGECMTLFRRIAPDVIILDIVMPHRDGIELLQNLTREECDARILLVSGASALYLASARRLAMVYGLEDVTIMRKPFRLGELRAYLLGEHSVAHSRITRPTGSKHDKI